MTSIEKIKKLGTEIIDLLVEKNGKYGDSALNPINIFSDGDAKSSLCARIDDKLARIRNNGINEDTEDTVKDLVGYLILLLLARDDQKDQEYPSSKGWYTREPKDYWTKNDTFTGKIN
jgi:hypothetical protein